MSYAQKALCPHGRELLLHGDGEGGLRYIADPPCEQCAADKRASDANNRRLSEGLDALQARYDALKPTDTPAAPDEIETLAERLHLVANGIANMDDEPTANHVRCIADEISAALRARDEGRIDANPHAVNCDGAGNNASHQPIAIIPANGPCPACEALLAYRALNTAYQDQGQQLADAQGQVEALTANGDELAEWVVCSNTQRLCASQASCGCSACVAHQEWRSMLAAHAKTSAGERDDG